MDVVHPPAVEVFPPTPLGAVAPALTFTLSGVAQGAVPVLLEGEPSSTDLGRLRRDDLTEALNARIVPSVWWSRSEGLVSVTPVRWLEEEATYSLVSPEYGVVATVDVRSGARRFERVWPPQSIPTSEARVVICGAELGDSEQDVELLPGSVAAVAMPGIGAAGLAASRCATVTARDTEAAGEFLLLPRELAGAAVDPAPVELAEAPEVEPVVCGDREVDVGAGCITPLDNRLLVRTNGLPALWALALDRREVVQATNTAEFVVPDLAPGTVISLRGLVLDARGGELAIEQQLALAEPAGAPVISEVYADALGPEPFQEWVEIVNVGAAAADLTGWILQDATAATVLPAATLAPGAYAVVLTPDYDATLDPAPARGTLLLFVDAIGGQGLTNSGEALKLLDPDGVVRSRFPARAARPGVSSARRFPWSPDSDPTSFGRHAAPGASPGTANVLEE